MRSTLGARVLSGGISLVSRVLMKRDAMLGRVDEMPQDPSREDFFFMSNGRKLAAVWVAGPPGAPVVLLCHGIGETVQHWGAVQMYLRERGVGSMICNYSGYGKSEGSIRPEHCDEDFVAAYAELRRRAGLGTRVFVLGFSMGSGVVASGAGGLIPPADGVFLCQAFSSMRDAMRAWFVPSWIAHSLPDLWNTVEAVREMDVPICVVHSDGDEMFPLEMAQKISAAAGCDLVVAHGLRHIEPYLHPTDEYWAPVVQRILRG